MRVVFYSEHRADVRLHEDEAHRDGHKKQRVHKRVEFEIPLVARNERSQRQDHRDLRDDIRPPAWPRTLDGDHLFYMTGLPAHVDLGLCVDGDCRNVETMYDHQVLRAVKVSSSVRPKGAYIPRRIELEVRYWQMSVTQKMLLHAKVHFSEWSAVPRNTHSA